MFFITWIFSFLLVFYYCISLVPAYLYFYAWSNSIKVKWNEFITKTSSIQTIRMGFIYFILFIYLFFGVSLWFSWNCSIYKGWYTKSKSCTTNWLLSLETLNLSERRICQENVHIAPALTTDATCLPSLNMNFTLIFYFIEMIWSLESKNYLVWFVPLFRQIRNSRQSHL